MLDVIGSINHLKETTEQHFLHIKNQHEFMRGWAIQFEIAYTDFRVIQLALQLAKKQALLVAFTQAYQAVYHYESVFAAEGLAGFQEKFADQLPEYEQAKGQLLAVLAEITKEQPPVIPENELL